MSANIGIEGVDELSRVFGVDLPRVLQDIGVGIAAEAQDRIAPYPPATIANNPSNPAGRWYKRGEGEFYQRKRDGIVVQYSSSETLGRRWNIKRLAGGAILENRASYAGYVHDQHDQAQAMARIGWKTDQGVVDSMEADGTVAGMTEDALKRVLKV